MKKNRPNKPVVTVALYLNKLIFYHNLTREEVRAFLEKKGMVQTVATPQDHTEFQFI